MKRKEIISTIEWSFVIFGIIAIIIFVLYRADTNNKDKEAAEKLMQEHYPEKHKTGR